MLMYGDWGAEDSVDVQDGALRGVAVVAEPKEPVPGQGFEFDCIGNSAGDARTQSAGPGFSIRAPSRRAR